MKYYALNDSFLAHYGVKGMRWYIRKYQPYGKTDHAAVKGRFIGEVGSHEKETSELMSARQAYFKSKGTKDISYEKKTDRLLKGFAKDAVKGRTDVKTVELIREMAKKTYDPGHRIYLMSKTPNAFSAKEIHQAVQEYAYDKMAQQVISKRALRAYTKASKSDDPEYYTNAKVARLVKDLGYGQKTTSALNEARQARASRLASKFNKAITAYNVTPEGTYKPLNTMDRHLTGWTTKQDSFGKYDADLTKEADANYKRRSINYKCRRK